MVFAMNANARHKVHGVIEEIVCTARNSCDFVKLLESFRKISMIYSNARKDIEQVRLFLMDMYIFS
jgi:hypothetical protein